MVTNNAQKQQPSQDQRLVAFEIHQFERLLRTMREHPASLPQPQQQLTHEQKQLEHFIVDAAIGLAVRGFERPPALVRRCSGGGYEGHVPRDSVRAVAFHREGIEVFEVHDETIFFQDLWRRFDETILVERIEFYDGRGDFLAVTSVDVATVSVRKPSL